jgi:hypothetical protein
MTEEEKPRIESLRSQAESLGLLMRKGDSEGLYYLAKQESLSGDSRRVGPDMSLDDCGIPHGRGSRQGCSSSDMLACQGFRKYRETL